MNRITLASSSIAVMLFSAKLLLQATASVNKCCYKNTEKVINISSDRIMHHCQHLTNNKN